MHWDTIFGQTQTPKGVVSDHMGGRQIHTITQKLPLALVSIETEYYTIEYNMTLFILNHIDIHAYERRRWQNKVQTTNYLLYMIWIQLKKTKLYITN